MNPLRSRIQVSMKIALGSTLLLLIAAYVSAHVAGPPPGYTGAPGDEACDASGCHTPPPTAPVTGFGISATPVGSDTVAISVTVSVDQSQGSLPFGFQAIVLDTAGLPIGDVVLVDPGRTQMVVGGNGRTYVSHTQAGVMGDVCSNCESWTFRWVRPDTPVAWVMVYGAGCLGDGDGTPAGDFVRTSSRSFGLTGNCVVSLTGDANGSGTVTSADIILLVGYIFKGGAQPQPCEASGDANCTGTVNSADIIFLVNFVFKAGRPPCDVCSLIPDVWPC